MPVSEIESSSPPGVGDPDQGFGIYLHWPFCTSKCPYCDFNSHVRGNIDQAGWRDALLSELTHFAGELPARKVTSIFFGGGTPSLMPARTVAAILDRIAALWPLADDAEITLEANPTSVEAARFEAYRRAGVNRLSLGMQALDDEALRILGRNHTVAEALAALDLAQRHFPRFSFDLMYARSAQGTSDWSRELGRALGLAGGHLSLYQLTPEPGTPFHSLWRRGRVDLPDADKAAALYDLTQELCCGAGYERYEISNHARAGHRSRHNLNYWRYGEYLGVGPGAHGRLRDRGNGTVRAVRQIRAPEAWLAAVQVRGHATEHSRVLDERERAVEMMLLGFRLSDGLSRARFVSEVGAPPEDFVAPGKLSALAREGFLDVGSEAITVTPRGMPVLDSILGTLLAGVN